MSDAGKRLIAASREARDMAGGNYFWEYVATIYEDDPKLVALVEALRKSANRLEWCAGLIHVHEARDKASEFAEEARADLAAWEQKATKGEANE